MSMESTGPIDVIDADSFDSLLDDVAGHLNAQTGRLLDLTVWLLANPSEWQGDGLWTPNQYLAWRCGIGPAMASNLVAAAERAAELPVACDAVRRGEMSLDQLMPIVRAVPGWADEQAVSLAKRLTVSQTRRLVRETNWDWQPGDRPDLELSVRATQSATAATVESAVERPPEGDTTVGAADDQPTLDENRVRYGHGPDGRWFLHADLDADLGALIESALDEARDAVFSRSSSDRNPHDALTFRSVSDVDALVEIAQRSFDAIADVSRRNRYRVNLYLDVDGQLATSEGTAIPRSIARYLTCDGGIDPVFVESGLPASVGRSQRTIPDRTRRTVLHRDGHRCQVPGCTASRGLDLHHIIHWVDHGPTDTWNLITLCSRHHRMHHKHRLGITGDADHRDTLVFVDARGHPIRASGARPAPPVGPPSPIRGRYEHPLGERLDARWITFVDPNVPTRGREQQSEQHPDIA